MWEYPTINSVEINAGVTSAQSRVLAVLRDEARPLTLSDLQGRTGLHANTLRGHLDALVTQGHASRVAVRRGGRGRPAWGYLARQPEYESLAIALAAGLESEHGAGPHTLDPAAAKGGQAWGERLREQLGPVAEPRERVRLALEHTGFSPRVDGDDLTLHSCPLLEAARTHPAVVCAVHLGLIEGVLGTSGAELHPRPETLGCMVRLP